MASRVRSPSAVSVTSMTCSGLSPSSCVVTSSRRGGSQTSTRPVPSQPLVKRAANVPPTWRLPVTSAIQRLSRAGSVHASHRSSMSVA